MLTQQQIKQQFKLFGTLSDQIKETLKITKNIPQEAGELEEIYYFLRESATSENINAELG